MCIADIVRACGGVCKCVYSYVHVKVCRCEWHRYVCAGVSGQSAYVGTCMGYICTNIDTHVHNMNRGMCADVPVLVCM